MVKSKLAIASFVLGLLSLLANIYLYTIGGYTPSAFFSYLFVIAFIFGGLHSPIISIVLGAIALKRIKEKRLEGRKLAIWGIVFGSIYLIFSLIFVIVMVLFSIITGKTM